MPPKLKNVYIFFLILDSKDIKRKQLTISFKKHCKLEIGDTYCYELIDEKKIVSKVSLKERTHELFEMLCLVVLCYFDTL